MLLKSSMQRWGCWNIQLIALIRLQHINSKHRQNVLLNAQLVNDLVSLIQELKPNTRQGSFFSQERNVLEWLVGGVVNLLF